jgi:hypothetical protein
MLRKSRESLLAIPLLRRAPQLPRLAAITRLAACPGKRVCENAVRRFVALWRPEFQCSQFRAPPIPCPANSVPRQFRAPSHAAPARLGPIKSPSRNDQEINS